MTTAISRSRIIIFVLSNLFLQIWTTGLQEDKPTAYIFTSDFALVVANLDLRFYSYHLGDCCL